MTAQPQVRPLGSVEKISATCKPAPGDDYTGATAELSLTPYGGDHSWQAAEIIDNTGTYTVRTTSPVAFSTLGAFYVYVRINSGSAHPVARAGMIRVM